MRRIFDFLSLTTVDDVQAVTNSWVPPPPSCLVTDIEIPNTFNNIAAQHIQTNLGPANLERVGKTWWQWRKLGSVVRAEWVEMKHDYLERTKRGDSGTKVMFYVHGGAYHLGGSAHAPQVQRHARK
jgi:acetyl esterase/lipase